MTHVSDWAGGWVPIHLRPDRAWHTLPNVLVLPTQRGRPGRGAIAWCHILGHDLVRRDSIEVCRSCGRTRGELAPSGHDRLRAAPRPVVVDLRSPSGTLEPVDLQNTLNGHAAGLLS